MNRRLILLIGVFGLSWLLLGSRITAWSIARSNRMTTVKRSGSAIAITRGAATLLVVNPDSNTLTLVDTAGQEKVAKIPAGVDPRTVAVDDVGRRAYVANRGSGSISVVDLTTRTVVAEVPSATGPTAWS